MVFLWLLWGDFCFMLMENVIPSLMPLKLKALGASNTTIGMVVIAIPSAINTVFNPIISFRSDRFRSRWGRRIPFILFSMPFLVLSLVGLGFGDAMGDVFHKHLGPAIENLSPRLVIICGFGVLMVLFSVFNTFVNSTFWYLFNDVVPEELLARFMSWFRMISLISVSLYNFLVFPYATSHFREILVGTALLYLVGFGLMCLNVKEGDYPPAPASVGGRSGFRAGIATYLKECLTLRHYWWLFLGNLFLCAYSSTMPMMVFFYQGTGLDLDHIGKILATINISTALFVLGAGWLADRYNPIRVVLAGQIFQVVVVLPISCIWLFWQPSPSIAFWMWMGISLLMTAPASAFLAMSDPPLLMRIFPRERYGQFCSANAICKSIGTVLGGVLAGLFLDLLTRTGSWTDVYTFLPIVQILFSIPVVFFLFKLYRSWKAYGGDSSYSAPLYQEHAIDPAKVPAAAADLHK